MIAFAHFHNGGGLVIAVLCFVAFVVTIAALTKGGTK